MIDEYDSTDDRRTANDVVGHKYRALTDEEKMQVRELKDMGEAFIRKCDGLGESRELSIARTNIEQAVMWSVKHVTS